MLTLFHPKLTIALFLVIKGLKREQFKLEKHGQAVKI